MNNNEASASTRNETTVHVATGHGTANPVARSLFVRPPIWNRRREILVGTRDKVIPDSAKTRRIFKIAATLGPKFALYSWMLNGIGSRDHLKFYIDHAAEQIGVNEKTIDRQLAAMEQGGWITRLRNIHGGNRTYSTYILNPINEIIGDDGHGPTLQHFREPGSDKTSQKKALRRRDTNVPTRKDTDVPTKGAKKKRREQEPASRPSLSSFSSHPSGAKQAEAGRAGQAPATADAGFATRGDTHSKMILAWVSQNQKMFTDLGFKAQNPSSLVKDILRFTEGVDERWDYFVSNTWLVLREQCRASDWLSQGRCRVGFGWLFLPSKKNPAETNLEVMMLTRTYSDLGVPETMFKPGDRVMVTGQPTPKVVLGFRPGSLTTYRLLAETITDPDEIEINTVEFSVRYLSPAPPASERVVLAAAGSSESVAVVEKPEAPSDDDQARAAREAADEAELDKLLESLRGK